MIHILLNITRTFFVLDTETTGTNTDTDHIIEIGFEQWGPEGPCGACNGMGCPLCKGTARVGGLIKEWRSYVNPLIPIPEASSKVHGITDDFIKHACRHCQDVHDGDVDHEWAALPTFKQLAPSLARGFIDCDFAGKNVRFDLRITAAEMKRAGVEWSYVGARVIDADRLEQLAVPRDLGSLHEKYTGRRHDGAHGALSDVRASTTVIVKQLEAHVTLPRDLDALHEAQWPGWLTSDGGFRMVDGVARIMFGKHRGKAMRDVEASYWDWILREKFNADVKALASAAKLGNYPGDK